MRESQSKRSEMLLCLSKRNLWQRTSLLNLHLKGEHCFLTNTRWHLIHITIVSNIGAYSFGNIGRRSAVCPPFLQIHLKYVYLSVNKGKMTFKYF